MNRRTFIANSMAILCLTRLSYAAPFGSGPKLEVVTTSPWLSNGFTMTPEGAGFINFPRFKGHFDSPALARLTTAGPVSFPGNHWNDWKSGDSGRNTLVNVNAVHNFGDSLIWVVDQGAAQGEKADPGAAKLVAFDANTGAVEKLIRFDEHSFPAGGAPNDLRIHGKWIYVTDSGTGGIVIHNMETSQTYRKLSQSRFLRKPAELAQKGFRGRILEDAEGKRPSVHSDMIEVTADGEWLYVATPTGPLYRINTHLLADNAIEDDILETHLEKVADIPSIGGSAIDQDGNLYLSDTESRAIICLKPDGTVSTIIQDDRLVTPDALMIDDKGWMYVPAPQIELLSANNRGAEMTSPPWYIYRFKL
ncbi:bleomycin resistance protein [Enterobacteriaceae bacterium RIT697]|nr:bleomycin resistance protein [Enterobacteriaceae bacterium RIT697]